MSESQPEQSLSGLQAPSAPSREETVADPQATLQWISNCLAQIYSVPTPVTADVKRTAYANIYTVVWNYCQTTKDARSSRQTTAATSKDLYSTLEQAIRGYCRKSLERIVAGNEANATTKVLSTYTEQWTALFRLSSLVTHLFNPLEDRWIRREIDEAAAAPSKEQAAPHHIPELHNMVWKEEVLKGSTKISDAIVDMQHQGQRSKDDQEALDEILASLSKVGLVLSNGSLVESGQK